MNGQRQAVMIKYDIEDALNDVQNVPQTLNGYRVDPETLVDIFILRSLASFEVCTFYPATPVITEQAVLTWFDSLYIAKQKLWRIIKVPPQYSGTEVSYVRLGSTIWLFYII